MRRAVVSDQWSGYSIEWLGLVDNWLKPLKCCVTQTIGCVTQQEKRLPLQSANQNILLCGPLPPSADKKVFFG